MTSLAWLRRTKRENGEEDGGPGTMLQLADQSDQSTPSTKAADWTFIGYLEATQPD